jgi:superfamily II DNA or RNA helicase
MATFDQFYASMDPDKNVRGDQFEKSFVPWFLKTDPNWKSLVDPDKIWLWDDYPKRWGRDCGIDLVFQDKNGKHWAVQSKCFHPENSIPKNEINKFFSESNDKRIYGRVLIATTDRISDNAKQMIERQEKQVVCFLLDNFRKSEVEFPGSLKDLNKGKRKEPRTPRKHQDRAIRDVVCGLQKARMGQLIMACGTGKTLTSLWIKEELEAQQVLVLVPSLSLLSQTLREWSAAAKTPFKWLCVCSDESVAKQDRTEDSWFTHAADIGVPVTGDVKEIKSFLRSAGAKVVFSTYQSSPLIAAAQRDRKIPAFDIAFADEAHRCAGNVSEAFSCVLDSKRIRSDKVLFMTATPRILSKQTKSKAEGRDTEIVSMDDPQVFGEVLHQLKFSQAIDQDLLSDYRVVIVGVDHPTVQERIQNRKLLRTSNGVKLDAETLATHVALAKAVKDYNLHRVISFHSRVAGAKSFAQDHTEVLEWMLPKDRPNGTTITDFVSGDMNSGDRNTKINRLRHLGEGERGILSNARCLSEGVDVPSLDGVAFIDPRKSQVDIVQAVGRAIRKSDGKTHGTILIPVFIDEHEDETEALESSRFKPIWDVVNALRSHDDDLAHELDSLRTELGKRKSIGASSRGLKKIVFDLPEMCEQSFVDGLRTRLVEQTTASWMFWYGLLQDYAEEYGDARPSQRVKFKGCSLGVWVQKQRQNIDSHSKERRQLLESLKGWSWDLLTDQWNEGFERLKAYAAKNDHARPALGFKTKDGFTLRVWVSTQRNTKDSLSPERIALLESLKGWSWDLLTDQWNEGFERLKAYAAKNDHASPSQDFKTPDGFALGIWVSNKRTGKNSLTPENKQLLENLKGWSWDPNTDKWNEGFERLKAYAEKIGNARTPNGFRTDGFPLGTWVGTQRTNKDSLTSKKKQLLESLTGWSWDLLADKWDEGFKRLKAYETKNGNARPKNSFKKIDGFALPRWVATQRTNKDSLTLERIALLESLKGWSWDPYTDQWNEGFERLKAYAAKNDHARPEKRCDSDGFPLGQWIGTQRTNKDSLSSERKRLLENLKGWSWDPIADQWNDGFERIKAYAEETGAGSPPQRFSTHGFAVGKWVCFQRKNKDNLTPERIALLESLKGWSWDPYTDQWNDGFERLKAYAAKNDHSRPALGFKTKDGFNVGQWVSRQRKNKDTLTAERIALLESLKGWSWDLLTDQWNEGFERLKAYAEETGAGSPPQRFSTHGFAVGRWVHTQLKNKDKLTKERKRLLESLPGWVWSVSTKKK